MQPYRCYFLDGANQVVQVEDRQWPDDYSAACWADSIRQPPAAASAELWCRSRLVRRREGVAP